MLAGGCRLFCSAGGRTLLLFWRLLLKNNLAQLFKCHLSPKFNMNLLDGSTRTYAIIPIWQPLLLRALLFTSNRAEISTSFRFSVGQRTAHRVATFAIAPRFPHDLSPPTENECRDSLSSIDPWPRSFITRTRSDLANIIISISVSSNSSPVDIMRSNRHFIEHPAPRLPRHTRSNIDTGVGNTPAPSLLLLSKLLFFQFLRLCHLLLVGVGQRLLILRRLMDHLLELLLQLPEQSHSTIILDTALAAGRGSASCSCGSCCCVNIGHVCVGGSC
mmetsp:Transcript_25852/g.74772  ORF Transcript_25852/g.74772 Transcript_25852/m.74772 type:complete len:274 (-) Transcript_25852:69-890(-)